jgi:hypothetical protein
VVLLAFAGALVRQRDAILQMSRLGPGQLGIISAALVVHVSITGLTTRLYLLALGVRIGIGESFWLAAVTSLCGYLPLHVNLLIRAKYLNQLHALSYASYTAMVLTNLGVLFCAIGVYGLASLAFLSWTSSRHHPGLYALFALCVVLPATAGRWVVGSRRSPIGYSPVAGELVAAVETICRRRVRVVGAVALTVVALAFWSVRFYQAAQHVAPGDRLPLAIVLPPVATLSTYLAITPNGLGVRELLSSGLTEVLGMEHTAGLAVTTIDRAVSVIWHAILGLLGTVILGRRARRN